MKIITSFILSFVCISCFSQSISTDRMETDGRHQLMTSTKDYSIGGNTYSIGMKIYEDTYTTDWLLLVSSFNCITDDTVILFKLNNGQTIVLPVNNVHTGPIQSSGYVYNIGNIGVVSPGSSKTYYSSVYELYQEDLDSIEVHGIAKMRIGNDIVYNDKEWKNNSLGKYISKCRTVIQKRRQKQSTRAKKRGSVFDDF